MNEINRSRILRLVLLVAGGATLVVFGSQSSVRSSSRQPAHQEPDTRQAKHDCDIDGSLGNLEDCPSDEIIRQYKEKYDLTVVRRRGVYWQVVSGEYVNEKYGYRVLLPDGVEALCAPAPAPWHGFFVDVANELEPPADARENHKGSSWANRNACVYVEAHYNSLGYASADDAANASLGYYKEDHPADLIILNHERTTLRMHPAVRYVVQFVDAESGETIIAEEVVAIRDGNEYNIGLATPAARYRQDAKVLRQILKRLRFIRSE